jgi:hypothetical protein
MQIQKEVFEHWLFSQPREREFQYLSNTECLLCAFIKETTNLAPTVGGFGIFWIWPSGTPYVGELVIHQSSLVGDIFSRRKEFRLISIGEAQDIYISLYGDPRIIEPDSTPIRIPVNAPNKLIL